MYNLSQLNELLIPELADIADQLHIPNTKKTSREELISLILEKQNNMAPDKNNSEGEKPKRKRIIKGSKPEETSSAEEVAKEAPAAKPKKAEPEKKMPVKKAKPEVQENSFDEEEELQPITSEQTTIPAAFAKMLHQ